MKDKKAFLSKKEWILIAVTTVIGLVAGVIVGVSQLDLLSEDMKVDLINQLGSENMLLLIASIQVMILTCLTSIVGLKLSKSVGLKLHTSWKYSGILLSLAIGLVAAFVISASDKFVFAPYLPETLETYTFSLKYFLASVLYGGIIEEILLRLFVMSLIVWLISKFGKIKKEDLVNKDGVYIAAIFIAALLFAVGHLPTTLQLLGSSLPIMIRMILLNGIAGIGFGYLYWKKGLSYAMLAHAMTHVFVQLLFMPLFY